MNKYIQAAHSIEIPRDAHLSLQSGAAEFTIETPHGSLSIEAGRCGSVFIRGVPEAVIGFGVIEPHWLPGLPGNNVTAQSVYFENDGPLLIFGKNRRGKRPTGPRIIVRAWGLIQRTVDVQVPASEEQQEVVKALRAALDAIPDWYDQPRYDRPPRPAYRAEGNVIYFPTPAERRAAP